MWMAADLFSCFLPHRQHFQGLRRAQQKFEPANGGAAAVGGSLSSGISSLGALGGAAAPAPWSGKGDPTLNPITRRPGPGRGRPRKQSSGGTADDAGGDGSGVSTQLPAEAAAASQLQPLQPLLPHQRQVPLAPAPQAAAVAGHAGTGIPGGDAAAAAAALAAATAAAAAAAGAAAGSVMPQHHAHQLAGRHMGMGIAALTPPASQLAQALPPSLPHAMPQSLPPQQPHPSQGERHDAGDASLGSLEDANGEEEDVVGMGLGVVDGLGMDDVDVDDDDDDDDDDGQHAKRQKLDDLTDSALEDEAVLSALAAANGAGAVDHYATE